MRDKAAAGAAGRGGRADYRHWPCRMRRVRPAEGSVCAKAWSQEPWTAASLGAEHGTRAGSVRAGFMLRAYNLEHRGAPGQMGGPP